MRVGVVLVLLAGCVEEREPVVADPMIQIASMRCEIAGAQVITDATFDVRLAPGQTFRVDHVAGLAGAKAAVYQVYGCNEWKTMQQGCARMDELMPDAQPVSLHMTDNVTGTLPDTVKLEVTGVVETEEAVFEASRVLTCLR